MRAGFSRSSVSSQMDIATVCVGSCLVGKVSVVLSWGGSLFVLHYAIGPYVVISAPRVRSMYIVEP